MQSDTRLDQFDVAHEPQNKSWNLQSCEVQQNALMISCSPTNNFWICAFSRPLLMNYHDLIKL